MVLFLRSKKGFRYIPENESEQDILGWNTSVVSIGMAGQIQSCGSTTYPARSPGDIRGRRHSVALQGGDFEGEERIFPSSCLGTHNLQYFYFLVSFHLYVHAYVNVIGTILYFSFFGEKDNSSLGDAKQKGGRHAD